MRTCKTCHYWCRMVGDERRHYCGNWMVTHIYEITEDDTCERWIEPVKIAVPVMKDDGQQMSMKL